MIEAKRGLLALFLASMLSGCGGGSDDAAPPVAPTISAQPADSQLTQGGNAQFQVSATIAGVTLRYQWQRSNDGGNTWADVIGATNATLSLTGVTTADSGAKFRVVITGNGPATTSSAATLTVAAVAEPPVITVQLAAQQVTEGANASFSITATGTALTYQWQRSTDGQTWSNIADATLPTLQLTALTASSNGWWIRAVVRNSVATVNSNPVQLTVQPATALPTFGMQPASITVTAPATATFTAVITGTPTPTLQWQRSTNAGATYADIAGATQASYTTPATSLSDTGTLLRLQAVNSAGTTLSAPATLTVAPALIAPTLQTDLLDVTAVAGQTVTWTVAGSGNPQPSYQWQLSTDGGATYANINGATNASYSMIIASTDNGRRVRVVLSNTKGTMNSRASVLTVTTAGVMVGRNWVAPQLLATGTATAPVLSRASTIDDAGRVTLLFRRNNGSRDVIYATRGTPNASGTAPTWTTPVPIDLQGSVPVSNMAAATFLSVTAAPGGDVVALWNHYAACTTTSYGTAPFQCRYYYTARYRIANDAWDAPQLLTDTPDGAFTTLVNDHGDTVFLGNSWVSTANLRSTAVKAVFMKTASETSFRRQLLSSEPTNAFANLQMDMDKSGNLLLATQYTLNGVAHIVAYRGTAAAGLGDPFRLDTLDTSAALSQTRVGLNGQQVITWYHPNAPTANNSFAATSANANAALSLTNLGSSIGTTLGSVLVVNDAGMAMLCSPGCRLRQTWTAAGGWTASAGTASQLFSYDDNATNTAINRNGDMLYVDIVGVTATYDTALIATIIANSAAATQTYVLGLANGSAGYAKPLLSTSGVGFVDMLNSYTTLPTPSATAGVQQTNAANLWGEFLK